MLFLACIVLAAFLTEAIVGFGSTVLTVTLGAHLWGIDALLVRFVPLNLLLSALLLARSYRAVEGGFLLRSVLPSVALGMGIGVLLSRFPSGPWVRLVFGLFVTALALVELLRLLRRAPAPVAPLPRPLGWAMLALGGVIHGLFGSGGPMIVYVTSRHLEDRGAMRATLSALWLLLNGLLLVHFLAQGKLSPDTLRDSLLLLPSLVLGLILGDRLHHRLPERPFRWMVYLVLLLAGGALTARTLAGG